MKLKTYSLAFLVFLALFQSCKKDTSQTQGPDYASHFVGTYITNTPNDSVGTNIRQIVFTEKDANTLKMYATGYAGVSFTLANCKVTGYSTGQGLFSDNENIFIEAYLCQFAMASINGALDSNMLVFSASATGNSNCNTGNAGNNLTFNFIGHRQ